MRIAELELNPAALPPGTHMGPWKLMGWRGRGTYGTVYRAVGADREDGRPVALKLAHHAEDERFEREVELLSRLDHPNVPRLVGSGHWQHPTGTTYPYLAMEWVEGLTLYEWARTCLATSRQVLRVLAQVARALEATHAFGGVHRDVKGDNVLVRPSDGHVWLLDFGVGSYPGAATLTESPLPPGTPSYRSPEAEAFAHSSPRSSMARYVARTADDIFALGVSAYRLVTSEYPPSTVPGAEGAQVWHEGCVGPLPPVSLNPRVDPRLNDVILRMLSVNPEARGSARELAEALEQATELARPEADQHLLTDQGARRPARSSVSEELVSAAELKEIEALAHAQAALRRPPPRVPLLAWLSWLVSLAVGLFLLVRAYGWALGPEDETHERVQSEAGSTGAEDGGTAALADLAVAEPVSIAMPSTTRKGVGLDLPKSPFPGQQRPPCKASYEVEIHGGCWTLLGTMAPCRQDSYEWKGRCYLPSFPAPREPTSEKPQ